jgi:hypothetical protein
MYIYALAGCISQSAVLRCLCSCYHHSNSCLHGEESFSASQEIPHILWNPMLDYFTTVHHLSPSWVFNPVHALQPYRLKTYFNIILPSTARSFYRVLLTKNMDAPPPTPYVRPTLLLLLLSSVWLNIEVPIGFRISRYFRPILTKFGVSWHIFVNVTQIKFHGNLSSGRRADTSAYHPPPGFDPRTYQPVASRCTDYAISANENLRLKYNIKTHLKGIWCEVVEHKFLVHTGDKEQASVKKIINFGFSKNEGFPDLVLEI